MLFNVLAAIADLGTHELAHGAVRHHGVLDRHALQDTSLGVHRRRGKLLGVHLAQALVALNGIALALLGDLAVLGLAVLVVVVGVQAQALNGVAQNLVFGLAAVGIHVMDLVAYLNAKDGRAGNIDIAGIDQRAHVLVEERQQQDADMRTINVCIGHDDDLVVARLADIEVATVAGARRDAAADRGDQGLDGVARERAVVTHALDVQNLAAQGQNRLDVSATAVLGRTACRVALYDKELGQLGIAHRAVGELAGQRRRLEQTFATGRLARLAGGVAGLAGLLGLLDDLAGGLGVLLQIIGQSIGHDLERERAHVGAAELGLGLALKLRIGQLNRNDGRKALAHVVTAQVGVLLLEQVLLAGVIVNHAGEGGAEALEMHAALGGVDVVGKRHDVLAIAGIPLQGHLDLAHLGHGRIRIRFTLDIDGLLKGLGDVFAVVEELNEVDDAALVAELLHVGSRLALVGQHNL